METGTNNFSKMVAVFKQEKCCKWKSSNLILERQKFSFLFCPTGEGPGAVIQTLWVGGFYLVNMK